MSVQYPSLEPLRPVYHLQYLTDDQLDQLQEARLLQNGRAPRKVAREHVRWILENHEPEPLEPDKQNELTRILTAAGKELG